MHEGGTTLRKAIAIEAYSIRYLDVGLRCNDCLLRLVFDMTSLGASQAKCRDNYISKRNEIVRGV